IGEPPSPPPPRTCHQRAPPSPQPPASTHHRRGRPRAVLEHEPTARAPRAIDEQAAAVTPPTVPERPEAIDVWVPVRVPVPVPVAREERAIVERIVERRPAEERIVEEGIKARAEGEAGAVIRPAIPVAEADRGVIVARIPSRIRVRRLDRVAHDVVVEVCDLEPSDQHAT